MIFLVGCMSILMGLLAEIMMRTYFESQDRKPYQIRAYRRAVPGHLNVRDRGVRRPGR